MSKPQPLLFVGKKTNHLYAKFEYSELLQQNRVTVYWGGLHFASYLEKDERPFRNAVAVMLANAGISKEDIGRVLRMNPKQVFRYVRQGNKVVEGTPGRPLVVDEELKAYVMEQYHRICADGRRRWRKEVQKLVQKKFRTTLALDTLSHIVVEGRKAEANEDSRESAAACQGEETDGDGTKPSTNIPEAEERPSEAPSSENQQKEEKDNPETFAEEAGRENSCEMKNTPAEIAIDDAKGQAESTNPTGDGEQTVFIPFTPPVDPTELPVAQKLPSSIVVESSNDTLPSQAKLEKRLRNGFYSRYAAALLLNPFLARLLQGVLPKERPMIGPTQFSLESFVLIFMQMNQFECNNYESILNLHPDEFGILGGVDRSPSRDTLYSITPHFLDSVEPIELGGRILKNYTHHLSIGSGLYFIDGHFQRYFGKDRLLTGYHPQTRHPQRGYYQYTVSGQFGAPLLLHDSDNLVSFPDAIAHLATQVISQTPEGIVPWFVFDRGGYQKDLLSRFAGADAGPNQYAAHYVSWDYTDDMDYREKDLDWLEVILELKGNDVNHPRQVKLQVAEAPPDVKRGIWANKSPARHQRRLILRRDYQRPEGPRTLCTPICSDDWEASPADLLVALTWRWRQENGFKQADGDYGFDQISTYAKNPITPEILKELPEEAQQNIRTRQSPNPAIKPIDRERSQLRRELGRIAERQERLLRGEKLRADRSKLRLPNDVEALGQLKEERVQRLKELDGERDLMPKQVGRFDRLCQEGAQRLDFRKKSMLDILRATAFNARRLAMDSWMSVYPDWRDYTERFRNLLNLGGWLKLRGKTLQVELKPMPQPRHQEAAESFVTKIKKLRPKTLGIGPFRIKFDFRK